MKVASQLMFYLASFVVVFFLGNILDEAFFQAGLNAEHLLGGKLLPPISQFFMTHHHLPAHLFLFPWLWLVGAPLLTSAAAKNYWDAQSFTSRYLGFLSCEILLFGVLIFGLAMPFIPHYSISAMQRENATETGVRLIFWIAVVVFTSGGFYRAHQIREHRIATHFKSMKRQLIIIVFLLATCIASTLVVAKPGSALQILPHGFAVPEPGLYVGTVTINTQIYPENLSSTYTLKAQGRVAPDGSISFLTTDPQAPSAAIDLESAVTRAAIVTVFDKTDGTPPGVTPLPNPSVARQIYLIDGLFPANNVVAGRLLTLWYQNPAPATGNQTTMQLPPKATLIVFKLIKQK